MLRCDMRPLLLLWVILPVLIRPCGAAQQEDQGRAQADAVELERIVVTPARQATLLKDAPCKVTVFTGRQIAETGARTLDQVFHYMPGINVVGDSIYQGMKPQVTLRGVPGQERTLVLIDGIPVNSAWQGRVEWRMIPVEVIERIECVHGPLSTLYGSGAMGGAINIITKEAKERSETTLRGLGGSLDTWSTLFLQGGRSDTYSYYAGGSVLKSAGYIPEKDPMSYSVRRGLEDWNAFLKIGYPIDVDSRLTVGFWHDDDASCRGREYFNIHDSANVGHATYERSIGKMRLKGSLFVNDQDWERDFDTGPNYNFLNMKEDIDHTYVGLLTEMDLDWGQAQRLTAGVDYKNGRIHLEDIYQKSARRSEANGRQELVAVFLQNESRFWEDSLVFSFGLREDYCRSHKGWVFDTGQMPKVPPFSYAYDAQDWTSLSPTVSLVYHPGEATTLRASFGRAFHAPDLKQLYMVLARPSKTVYNNSDLKPETLDSYEIGVDHRFPGGWEGRASFFYSRGEDFISTRTLSTSTSMYDNIDKVWMLGVETDLRYRINREWSCSAGYFFHESRVKEESSNAALDGNHLALQAEHLANARITFEAPRLLSLSVCLRYVGPMYADNENTDKLKDRCVCDLRIAKKWQRGIELSVVCENVFDARYDVPNEACEDLRSPGRMVFGSLTMRW